MFDLTTRGLQFFRTFWLRWRASRIRRQSALAWPARRRRRQKNARWLNPDISIRREDLF
jgi:hypothetical protein